MMRKMPGKPGIFLMADHPRPHGWKHLFTISGVEQIGFANRLVTATATFSVLMFPPRLLLLAILHCRKYWRMGALLIALMRFAVFLFHAEDIRR